MRKTLDKMLPAVALFAAAIATSCSSDNVSEGGSTGSGEGKTVTLTAKVNDNSSQTRVGMTKGDDGYVDFYWHSGDAILVQTVSGGIYGGKKFTTETETGAAAAKFSGTVASESSLGTYAVYPYSDKHKFTSATALTYNLPTQYECKVVESGIFSKVDGGSATYRSTSTNIPMVGKIAEEAIEFKHVGGLAVIRIDKMPATEGALTVAANEQLCGDFTIGDLSADGAAIATSASTATDDIKKVTFSFSGATKDAAGVFYLPLATGSYSGMKIEMAYGSTTQTVNYGNLYVARASVNAIPLYNIDDKLCKYSKDNGDGTYVINGQTFVDLGLPSGVLWASCNVGASADYEYGGHYAWGESATKEEYSWETYKYGTSSSTDGNNNATKYNDADGKTTLEAEDDAATRNWGAGCRMPTEDEIDELLATRNCDWTSTTVNGINGYMVTSKANGKSIFLPTAGHKINNDDDHLGETGDYWSSTLTDDDTVYSLYINVERKQHTYDDYYRFAGFSVRPVAEK